MTRVLRQRELVENMKHDNEILKLDLTRESRDARKTSSSGAAADIGRYNYMARNLWFATHVYNVLQVARRGQPLHEEDRNGASQDC
jgi:hypothetical protein